MFINSINVIPVNSFEAPIRINDGKIPINVDACHAAPLYVDYDEDGVKELLVGQFGQGKLRVYENKGTEKEPLFDGFTWLQAEGQDAAIPSG